MEEEHVTAVSPSNTNEEEGKSSSGKKALIGIGIILFVILVGGFSYLLGKQSKKGTMSPSPTPTSFLTKTPTVLPSPTSLPSPTPTPKTQTITLTATSNLDGFESSNGGGNATLDIRAGRNANLVTRGFVGFDLSTLPEEITISEAALRLYQTKTVGDPYSVGGNLMVDHLNYGNSLENVDYSASSLLSNLAVLSTSAAVEWKEADVTERVQNDLDEGRAYSQYRIHFTVENKGGNVAGDFVYFEAKEDSEGTGKIPELIIKYY